MSHTIACERAENDPISHRQNLIRHMIPSTNFHQAQNITDCAKFSSQIRLINHNNFRAVPPLLETSAKIRYDHIESEAVPPLRIYRPDVGTAREEVRYLPATAGTNAVLATPIATRFQSRDMPFLGNLLRICDTNDFARSPKVVPRFQWGVEETLCDGGL